MASLFLKKGADIHAKVINGERGLFVAAKYADPELARLLIKTGADTNAKNREKLTPLAYLNPRMESICKEDQIASKALITPQGLFFPINSPPDHV